MTTKSDIDNELRIALIEGKTSQDLWNASYFADNEYQYGYGKPPELYCAVARALSEIEKGD